jgi:MFS family permease
LNRRRERLSALVGGLPKAFWALWAGTLLTRAGTFVVPLLFVYLTQVRGLSTVLAGTILSLYGFGALCGVVAGGVLGDFWGRRPTILLSLLVGAFFMVLLGLVTEVRLVAPVAFLLGFSSDMFRPASQAMVADLVAPEHRLRAFGWQYWGINLGTSFAAVLGGFLAREHFTALFFADAATTLALAAIVWSSVPEVPRAKAHPDLRGSFVTPFVDAPFAVFLLLTFGLALVFFQHLTMLAEDMRQKGLGPESFGITVATNCLLVVLLQPFVTRWCSERSRAGVLSAGAALTGAGFFLTAFARSLPEYVGTVVLWTLGEIVIAPVNATIVADLAPEHLRGRYQGAFGLSWALAFTVAPALGPRVQAAAGLPTFWGLCGAVCAAIAAAHLVYSRGLGRRPASSSA